jgi:hypothetical protein
MPSFGIPYELVGPNGARAVFNDPADGDFCGYLNSENGITGLLDTPEVREGYFDKPEFSGGVQTNSFFSKRVGTIQGFLIPEPNMVVFNTRESKIKAASRGMEGEKPAMLYWTPEGRPQMAMRVYRQGKISVTGRRPKIFTIPLSSPDPFIFSAATAEEIISATAEAEGDEGFSSPIGPELEVLYKAKAHIGVVNEGDAETWPELYFKGPMVNPVIINLTTGQKFTLTYTLGAEEELIVNTYTRSVQLKSSPEATALVNRYSAYSANFAVNEWWPLVPGNNNIQFISGTGGGSVLVRWKSAWE